MKKKILGIIICTLLITTLVLPVTGNINDVMKNDRRKNGFMQPSNEQRIPIYLNYDSIDLKPTYQHLSRGAPDYEFEQEPITIMTSSYDYMPGSYASHPIRLQTENGDGKYLTFFGQENATATRRQYWAYADSDDNIQHGLITTDDVREGYGSIGIHPATGDPVASWHVDIDEDAVYDTALTYDDFDASEIPGVWEDPLVITPPGNEYIWPYIQVGPSPDGEDYVRIYQITNDYTNLPSGNPCEDVRLMWIDVENTNGADLSGLLSEANWDEVTVFTDWRDKSCRPFQAFAIDYNNPGKVGFIGTASWLEGDLGNMPVDEGAFVWESYDYGETWSYDNLFSDGPGAALYYVENTPEIPDAPNELEVTSGGWHSTALYDYYGDLHWTYLQSYGYTDDDGSYYFPEIMPQAEMVWDGSEFAFHEVPELPGIDPLSGHTVPWVGDVIYPVVAWSMYPSAGAGEFHENTQKQAINVDNDWMLQMWVDGTYHYLGNSGDPDYVEYIEHPLIFISISTDNGETWFDPIELTDIFSEEFDFSDQITVYPYVCDQIVDLGDDWGQIYMYYMDDEEYGSKVHGTGLNPVGNITYCSLNIKFAEPLPDPEVEIAQVSGGLGKVKVDIENIGEVKATDVEVSITVQGGYFGMINVTTEVTISSIDEGETETVSTDAFIFGLGNVNITIDADYAMPTRWKGTGLVLGPFVLGITED